MFAQLSSVPSTRSIEVQVLATRCNSNSEKGRADSFCGIQQLECDSALEIGACLIRHDGAADHKRVNSWVRCYVCASKQSVRFGNACKVCFNQKSLGHLPGERCAPRSPENEVLYMRVLAELEGIIIWYLSHLQQLVWSSCERGGHWLSEILSGGVHML
jgi:hypothetical protein